MVRVMYKVRGIISIRVSVGVSDRVRIRVTIRDLELVYG
jgi:hypothetical protein